MPGEESEFRKGRLTVEGEYATIMFRRILHHPPELVWQAITDPDELKGWLMCSFAKIDGRTGGTVEMVSGPNQYHVKGKILAWDPPNVYEHEWKVSPVAEMPQGEDAVFRYELTPHRRFYSPDGNVSPAHEADRIGVRSRDPRFVGSARSPIGQ